VKNNKLNVGVFTHDFFPYVGGQGRHIHELYKQNLKSKDINLTVFSPSNNELPGHVQLYPETAKSKFKNLSFSLKLHRHINKIIKQYSLDIIHVHGGPGGLFFIKPTGLPIIYTCHHTYWQQSKYVKGQSWKKFFISLESKGYRKAVKNICVSTSSQSVLIDHYNIQRSKTILIPNGIDKSLFKPNKTSTRSKNIIFVGRLDERKGILFLVETMQLVNQIDKAIQLHVVGTGKLLNILEDTSKKQRTNIKFYGFVSDDHLNDIYEKVSCQIVPSIFEGFGITVLEAMAKRVAVIATNVDGVKDIIKPNQNGILVEYGNKSQLAKSIIDTLQNSEKTKQLIENGKRTLQQYQWSRIYGETVDVYKSTQ
jgi:glycosyltransferase involved in cell wall biosynthesis